MTPTVQAYRPLDSALEALLDRHPGVELLSEQANRPGLTFMQGPWLRQILVNDPSAETAGLLEFIDNNPLVCADTYSVPGPAATLASIAIAPLARAGLILDEPVWQFSFEPEDDWEALLGVYGEFPAGEMAVEEVDLKGAVALTALIPVSEPDVPEGWNLIDELFVEAYGRSFYVRNREEGEWDTADVSNQPHASYRLRLTADTGQGLLRVQVMADLNGKAGASQIVHALNVMVGFEETRGLENGLA